MKIVYRLPGTLVNEIVSEATAISPYFYGNRLVQREQSSNRTRCAVTIRDGAR